MPHAIYIYIYSNRLNLYQIYIKNHSSAIWGTFIHVDLSHAFLIRLVGILIGPSSFAHDFHAMSIVSLSTQIGEKLESMFHLKGNFGIPFKVMMEDVHILPTRMKIFHLNSMNMWISYHKILALIKFSPTKWVWKTLHAHAATTPCSPHDNPLPLSFCNPKRTKNKKQKKNNSLSLKRMVVDD